MLSRRAFLASVPLAALASRIRAEGEGSGMCLAYTSFAVRMLQGRDILKSTAAALPASALLDLCVRFGAHGGQIDWSQIESHEPDALAALKARADRDHLRLELSVPATCLESPEAYADMVKTATALGVTRVRIALLYGRRYESFKTRDEWTAWHAKWVAQLQTMKPVIEAHPIVVGIENHKDISAPNWLRCCARSTARSIGVLRRLRQQHLAARGSETDPGAAGALRRHDAPQGHGGEAHRRRLRAVGGAAGRGDPAAGRR